MKDLTITISGKANTGKSRLIFFIKGLLENTGFDVNFDPGEDFKDIEQFNEIIGENFHEAITAIKPNIKIKIKEERVS